MGLLKLLKNIFGSSVIISSEESDSSNSKNDAVSELNPVSNQIEQVSGSKRENETDKIYEQTRELGIGIDFGSSCTKVVIQDISTSRKWAIPFSNSSISGNPYLVPSALVINQDSTFSLNGVGDKIEDIKQSFIDGGTIPQGTQGLSPTIVTAAFISLILRRSLEWFDSNLGKYFEDSRLVFQLNLGFPAKNFSDKDLIAKYREVSLAAWYSANSEGQIGVKLLEEMLEKSKDNILQDDQSTTGERNSFNHQYITIIPEVVAGIFGFAKSQRRREGMCLLIDVGASTLDVGLFNLGYRDNFDHYWIYETDVRQYGARFYYDAVIKKTDDLIAKKAITRSEVLESDGDIWDVNPLFQPIPDIPSIRNYSLNLQDDMMAESVQMITEIMVHAITKKNNLAIEWETALPVAITGGGKSIMFYQELVKRVHDRIRTIKFNKFVDRIIETPSDLTAPDLPPNLYHRMQIAYGLSFRPLDFGAIINKDEIEDLKFEVQVVDYSDKYVGQEMV